MSAVKSAQKAILVNRISDGLLMWGILWVWYHLGSLEYDLLNVYSASGFVGLSILIGAMGKSAQILFHVWLADAMEGPTPVSALNDPNHGPLNGKYCLNKCTFEYQPARF